MAYDEYKTDQQSDINWGESLNMSVKAPAVAKRIFERKSDAQAYIDDVSSSAIAGIRITVINDGENGGDGLYYVAKSETAPNGLILMPASGSGSDWVDYGKYDVNY